MSADKQSSRVVEEPARVRFHLWSLAFETATQALTTAIRFRNRYARAYRKYMRNASKHVMPDSLVPEEFVEPFGLDRHVYMGNFDLGGLDFSECGIIQTALFEKACVEIMTVFGPMGTSGPGIAGNNAPDVQAGRDLLIVEIAKSMDLNVADIQDVIGQIRILRNEQIAHRSAAGMNDVKMTEISAPGGSVKLVSFSKPHHYISLEKLYEICRAAHEAADLLAFPEASDS